MNKLSKWASAHRWRARLLIAIGDCILCLIGIGTGIILFNINFHLSAPSIVIIAWAGLIVYYLFPEKQSQTPYLSRVYYHRAMYGLMFLLFLSCGNRLSGLMEEEAIIQEVAVPTFINQGYDKNIQPKPTIFLNQNPRRSSNDHIGSHFKNQLKAVMTNMKVRHQSLPSGRTYILLILSWIAALTLIMLLARLSSGPHCSGIGLAISLVSILATGAWVGAAVLLVMGIKILAGQ